MLQEIKEREVDLLKREFAEYKAHTSEVLTSLQTNMSKVTQWGWGTAAAAVPAVPAPSAPAAATLTAEEREVEDEAMPREALFVPAPNPPPVSPLSLGRVEETEHTVRPASPLALFFATLERQTSAMRGSLAISRASLLFVCASRTETRASAGH